MVLIKSYSWTFFGNMLKQLFNVVGLLIIARSLTPEQFGIFALIIVITGFMNIFSSLGVFQFVIFKKKSSEVMLSTLFYLSLMLGLFFSVLLYCLSNYLYIFDLSTELSRYLKIISISFIIINASAVQRALLEKDLKFKNITIVEIISNFFGVLIGVLLAVNDYGILSLIIMELSKALINSLIFISISDWKPKFYFSKKYILQCFNYTKHLLSFNTINYFSKNTDLLIISKMFGNSILGLYTYSLKIILFPVANISRVIVRVTFPALTQNNTSSSKIKKIYVNSLQVITFITLPLMILVFFIADYIPYVFLNEEWNQIGIILKYLAPVGFLQSINTTFGSVYMALNRNGLLLKVGIIGTILTLIFFIIGSFFNIEVFMLMYLLSTLLITIINLHLISKSLDFNFLYFIKSLSKIFTVNSFLFISLYITQEVVLGSFSEFSSLIINVILSVMLYCFFTLCLFRSYFLKLIMDLKKFK